MRLLCVWCAAVLLARESLAQLAQEDGFYAPQTYKNHIDAYQQGYFKPEQPWGRNDLEPQTQNRLASSVEPWSQPNFKTKEQSATILHHKQTLSKDGNFRYEFASDNGVAAGEVIEPDGTRVGAFQYKDPSGQLIKLKYRAGKEGFQILEGNHLPKSPEPVAYPQQGAAYQEAYTQQRQQFDRQQQHNLEPRLFTQQLSQAPQQFQNYPATPAPTTAWPFNKPYFMQKLQNSWTAGRQNEWNDGQYRPAVRSPATAGTDGSPYFSQNNWNAGRQSVEDDGQYRENDIENSGGDSKGPHNFGEGYAFEFQG